MNKEAIEEYINHSKAFGEIAAEGSRYDTPGGMAGISMSNYLKWLELKKLEEIHEALKEIAIGLKKQD